MTGYTTRIAPSPTGMFHIGTARTALFNWLAARASGGRFLIRIDDTDTERNQPEAIQPIFDGLEWLGLNPDDKFHQSDRTGVYTSYAKLLLDKGFATEAPNGAILLKLPEGLPASWHDEVAGDVAITENDHKQIDGLVLARGGPKLGEATYHFASVLDDYMSDINYIIRGHDHIANTAKQVAIWVAIRQACGHYLGERDLPKFSHVGLITKHKRKLSKRDGAASLLDYRDKGYDPDAIFNFLLRLGWGPKVDDKTTALLTRERALELFLDGGSMRNSAAAFDEHKLNSYDRKVKAGKGIFVKKSDYAEVSDVEKL